MLSKLLKNVNPMHLFVMITLFGICIYTIITYKSLIFFQRDVNRMKHQMNSLTVAVNGILNFQENSIDMMNISYDENDSVKKTETHETNEVIGENENTENVEKVEKPDEKDEKEEKEENEKQEESNTPKVVPKNTPLPNEQISIDGAIPEKKEEFNVFHKKKDDDNDSVTSNEIKNIMSKMLSDDESDDENHHSPQKTSNEAQKEKMEKMEKNEKLKTKMPTSVQNEEKKEDKKEENTKSIEEFIQGHVLDVSAEEPTMNGQGKRYFSEGQLSAMKYEELRQHLKNTYHVAFSKGTKADLVSKILEMQS